MTATFKEANQVRLQLKMKLAMFGWYNGSLVATSNNADEGYYIVVSVKHIDTITRKMIPQVINGISVRVEQN